MSRRAGPRAYLADTVYAELRRAILHGQFDPGEPLTEVALSHRYRVSRTPVREALAKLERDRLVRVVPKKGAFIRTLSHDEVRELYQIREQIGAAWTMAVVAPRRVEGLLREHLAIIGALKRGNTGQAERLMRAHVRRVRDTIFRLVE